MHKKILVVGPGRKTRGGISSVIKEYEKCKFWNEYNCIWIETYIDKSAIYKILYFFRGLLLFILNVWNTNIIHIHLSEPTSAIRKSFFFYIAYFLRKKIILHFHAFSPDSTINGKYKSIYRNLFIRSDLVIVLSQYWQKEIMCAYGENSITTEVLYNPCPKIPFKLCSILEREHYILYAGTLNKRKGYADLLYAFSVVAKKHLDWKLIMAGNGEIEKGLALTRSLGLGNQVTFAGWVSGEEKEKLFQHASVFCLPSYNEGFPMSVLDALAYGLPVIATPVGGLPDILVHGENAMVFQPGDINSLSKHLEELISNDILRENLSRASFKLSQGSFNIETISFQLSEIYNTLCK